MELETLSLCPVCEHNQFELALVATDYTVSKKDFQIERCKSCGFLISNPRPPLSSIGSYYESDDYVSHTQKNKGVLDFIYRIARSYTLRWKRGLLEKLQKSGRLLDYGCGTGQFLKTMQSSGWQVTGVEPTSKAREQARKLLSDSESVVHSELSTLSPDKFDIITLWHVLEHVHDLSGTLQQLKRLLKPDGHILIAVPNYQSWDASIYKKYWAAYDVPRHLWHFSKESMKVILQNTQLHLKSTIPMKLDAYYVSLLSEKNKSKGRIGIAGLLNGMWVAYQSNRKANAEKNHSSLIYIATHA